MTVNLYTKQGLRLDRNAVRRCLGVKKQADSSALDALIEEAATVLEPLHCRVCYCQLPVLHSGNLLDFGGYFQTNSSSLSKALSGCNQAVVFCATLGSKVDRALISLRLQPANAVVLDAAAGVAIEQLCDDFCATLPLPQRPRFSPGYGDLKLDVQCQLLSLLQAERYLGLTLTDSLLMTPTKSVSAIVGLL